MEHGAIPTSISDCSIDISSCAVHVSPRQDALVVVERIVRMAESEAWWR